MSKLEQALADADEIEAAEADQAGRPLPAHVEVSQPGRARSKVLQVRLNAEEFAALERIAERRELPVSTIARAQLLKLVDSENVSGPSRLLELLDEAVRIREIADDVRRELKTADPRPRA